MLIEHILEAMFFGTILWRAAIWSLEYGPPQEPPDRWSKP